ncbi:MAG: hypothetical protein Q9214_000323 [Letrouitia sp. 1 TL-2023]
MAPSATSAAPNDNLDQTLATDSPNDPNAKTQIMSVVPPAVQKNNITVNGAVQKEKPPEKQNKGKLSNAELKKRGKAEKAAKRAAAKQPQPDAFKKQRRPSKGDEKKDIRKQGSTVQDQNQAGASSKEHKRTGSTSGNAQKPLQLKSAISQSTAASAEPKKENKNVQLFAHLYGNPRRTTIAGTSKDVHPAVLSLGLQMSSYTVCGSNARCVATLITFKRVIESYTTPLGNSLPRHLTTHLSSQIDYLVSCRPLSISMGNAIRWLKLEISTIDPDTPESEAKSDLCSSIDIFIRERITVADQVIATIAMERIRDGDIILTFAKSSIVQKTLIQAYHEGRRFRVIVVDSRPLFEGKNLARTLADLGLEVQYTLTHALSHVIADVTKVFLGAHAMMSNGRLYSRVGTALVAMMAKKADIPVIVCCESVKFTDRVALDSIVNNEIAPSHELISQSDPPSPLSKWLDVPNLQLLDLMYDVTPSDFIHLVITEYGSLPPSSVPVVHRLSTNT